MTKSKSNNTLPFLFLGVLIVLAAIFAAAAFRPAPASVTEASPAAEPLPLAVTVDEAMQLRENGAFVLDVREPQEWEAGHIPGATLIPLGQLSDRLNEVPADQQVVVVCRSGNRSAQATQILRQAGLEQATSMNGGMNEWAAAGYEIVTGP